MTRHGFPTAIESSGISFVTTDPAPMVHRWPMVTPGRIVTLPPIQTSSPIVIGLAHSIPKRLSSGSMG